MGLLFGSGFGSGLLYVRASQVHESGGVSVARLKIIDSTPGSVCGFAGGGGECEAVEGSSTYDSGVYTHATAGKGVFATCYGGRERRRCSEAVEDETSTAESRVVYTCAA